MREESDDEYVEVQNQKEDDADMEDFIDDEEGDAAEFELKKAPEPKSMAKSSLSQFSSSAPKASSSSSSVKRDTPTRATPKQANNKKFEKENEIRYAWLEDIKDAEGNRPDHPDYDPRTLFIPKSAWAKFTPFETQYWEVKSKMWNTVVFFKKGKFYELYERDADIAHSQFDLRLAGGGRANMRLAGIPEMSFDHWASQFIAKGHKVAKVDQKETALAKEMRDSTNGKKEEKVIKRELSCVLTGGTLTDETMLLDEMSTFCMSIKQCEQQFAACFVDTATGEFSTTEFEDDVDYAQFETLIAQIRPREIILEKGHISSRAVRILKNNTSIETLWNYLKPTQEFWDSETTFEELVKSKYFEAMDLDDLSKYPKVLQEMASRPLLMSAFGGLLWYLKSLKIDQGLVSLGNFNAYESIRRGTSVVLDGQSLQNLEIFANTFDGGADGTLFKLLNRCITPFGKRKLRGWVSHPLLDVKKINARLDAVELLNNNYEALDYIEGKLSSLPDIERMLSRVHAGLIKVQDFVRVIDSFSVIYLLIVGLKERLDKLSTTNDYMNGKNVLDKMLEQMPPFESCLSEWFNAFDHERARREGVLIPTPGVENEFDESTEKIKEIEQELSVYIKQYKREFKSQEICFRDSGKEIYLIELPNKIKSIPKSWQQMASTSKVKRYWSPEVKALVRKLLEAKETHKVIENGVKAKLYTKFDEHYEDYWLKAVQVIGNIDCLVSLAKTSNALGYPSCRPEFIDNERGMLEFRELRHPCFVSTGASDFIPNDINLGGDHANITLLTGANAAGKSTVLRMTCVAVIMAQIGCFVPGEYARLSAVDRIMTRLGANDNIFAGKSTFFVELSETKRILSEATNKSLLVLDELGRGGSSSDGFAIAEAVLHHIASHVGSLGYFATHYGTLNQSFKTHPQVEPKRMAILEDEETKKITFLYKLENGISPGSFGMHVASMCGIEKSIVDRAEVAAKEFEHTSRMKKLLALSNSENNLLPLGLQSDFVWAINNNRNKYRASDALRSMFEMIKAL